MVANNNNNSLDVDQCIEILKSGECISENALKLLCRYVSELLMEESNVQPVLSPVTIVGDLHGQFFDLLNLLQVGGWPPDTSYVFLGDFVDRGHHSVETLSLLLCLKVKYPGHITLLRGNHESRQITQAYGFYDECLRKYGNASVWRYCVSCFDTFGLCALIDETVLCVHGGLSPDIRTLDQIRAIDRNLEIPHEGAFCDLVWSDPEDGLPSTMTWQISPRGAGYLFGQRVTTEFCAINNLQLIARAHQLVMEGRKYHFNNQQVVTVWSAPNYCYRCGNVAAVLQIGEQNNNNNNANSDVVIDSNNPDGNGGGSSSSMNSNNNGDGGISNNNNNNNIGAVVPNSGGVMTPSHYFVEPQQQGGDNENDIHNNNNNNNDVNNTNAANNNDNRIPQRFIFFRDSGEHSVHGPKGEARSNLVPYFL